MITAPLDRWADRPVSIVKPREIVYKRGGWN